MSEMNGAVNGRNPRIPLSLENYNRLQCEEIMSPLQVLLFQAKFGRYPNREELKQFYFDEGRPERFSLIYRVITEDDRVSVGDDQAARAAS